ncbi:MAG: phage tail protein [Waterburya sp.]
MSITLMTNGSNSSDCEASRRHRLDRIEAIVESNSRAIQAMMEQQATERLRHEERMERLEENLIETRQLMSQMAETQTGLTRILINYDEDRPTILRRLMAIENKVDRILERGQE